MSKTYYDFIILGAGMAGASVAAELSAHGHVLLLEREEHPGMHATGRSAAAFIPSYGAHNAALRILTRASHAFLTAPPPRFTDADLLSQRGLVTLLGDRPTPDAEGERAALNAVLERAVQVLDASGIARHFPAVNRSWATGAWWENDVYDIDVNSLHQAYLGQLRGNGGRIRTGHQVHLRRDRHGWVACVGGDRCTAPVVVNAAGAWADQVAEAAGVRKVGLIPMRRTVILIEAPPGCDVSTWPLVMAHDGSFYLKPDAGMVLVSPADEHPSEPCDAQPEELDVAYAAHYAEQVVQGLEVRSVAHRWAGLRTFAPDRTPVIGFDPEAEGFFWSAGQGGHGIQIAPAASRLAAALIVGDEVPRDIDALGFDARCVSPTRLRVAEAVSHAIAG